MRKCRNGQIVTIVATKTLISAKYIESLAPKCSYSFTFSKHVEVGQSLSLRDRWMRTKYDGNAALKWSSYTPGVQLINIPSSRIGAKHTFHAILFVHVCRSEGPSHDGLPGMLSQCSNSSQKVTMTTSVGLQERIILQE